MVDANALIYKNKQNTKQTKNPTNSTHNQSIIDEFVSDRLAYLITDGQNAIFMSRS